MIIDTSVIIAIVRDERDADQYREAMVRARRRAISAGTLLETSIAVERLRKPGYERRLNRVLDKSRLEIVPFDAEQAEAARQAYRDFGRGSGHPARLNFGDCFAYALATVTGEPLLFRGDGFSHTDVRVALVGD